MNQTIIPSHDETIEHMGVRGMKWGVRRATRKANSLEKKVSKTIRKFDRGKEIPDDALQNLSKKVRSEKYRVDKKIKRGQKFLSKYEKTNAKQIINRYNRDPLKKEAVDNYIKSMKLTSSTLGELRLQLMDAKL